MIRLAFGILGCGVLVSLAVLAANTAWALPYAVAAVAAVFLGDYISERRPSNLTNLQRFEARQSERAKRAA